MVADGGHGGDCEQPVSSHAVAIRLAHTPSPCTVLMDRRHTLLPHAVPMRCCQTLFPCAVAMCRPHGHLEGRRPAPGPHIHPLAVAQATHRCHPGPNFVRPDRVLTHEEVR